MNLQALLDRAIALQKGGYPAKAEPLYAQLLHAAPDQPRLLFNHGSVLRELNRHAEALARFDRVLALQPGFVPALNNRGLTLFEMKRFREALDSYDAALAIDPRNIQALSNRGYVLAELARFDEALESFDRAPGPRPVEVLNGRGLVLAAMKRFAEALASYDAALAIDPRHPGVLNNRGLALLEMRRPIEALAGFDAALALDPRYGDACYNRARALQHLGRLTEALAGFDAALALDPDNGDALNHRGFLLLLLGRLSESLATFEKALARGRPDALGQVAELALRLCDWRRVAEVGPKLKPAILSGQPVPLLALMVYGADPALQLAAATNATRRLVPVTPPPLWRGTPRRNGKIRLAYLSAMFHNHPTAFLMAELFELHDRSRFEVSAISFGPDSDGPMRARLIKAFDNFAEMRDKNDADIARFMLAKGIDIAIDLNGHIVDGRPGIFAHRAAPVQVNYLGYPGTLGAGFMDYIIGDPLVTPFARQPFFTEKIVQLPDCYQVNDSKRAIAEQTPSRATAGLPDQGFVFCCFNNNLKITEPVFSMWMRLLTSVPGSVLWLYESNQETGRRLRQEAAARGVEPARLVFAPRLPLEDHLARHRLADLFLDTLPYNAHTTASDALWAGLPFLTCRGETFPGRVAASLLAAVGLPELVTDNLEDYETLALKLARDPALLAALRAKLQQNRVTRPLFDTDRFRRHIEAAYVQMWEIAKRGEPPRSFRVE